MESSKKYILSKEAAEKKLCRMALQIAERNYGETQLVLAGIKENGVIIAQKMATYLADNFKGELILTELSINKVHPAAVKLIPDINLNNKTVLLIDDVANSGRTMLYALQPLLTSYPKSIQTLVLVERTHKSFPIALDYVGLSFSTTLDEHVNLEVQDGIILGAWM